MPFIPHTENDVQAMLKRIGVSHIDDLFDEIPQSLRINSLADVPTKCSEMHVSQLLQRRASEDGNPLCFVGAGAYKHHIPAAVWEIATRGEFYSAYTPYQAEASQGTLQLIYEYQSMISSLTGMDVSNASLYDGASALAEAILMAVRANKKSKSKRILLPRTVHPAYRRTAKTIVSNQNIRLEDVNYDRDTGTIDPDSLAENPGDIAALVIQQPNFFGTLEDVHALTNWAHQHNIMVISVTNPTSLAVLTPPGEWGDNGVDIACGEGQPLGIPLASGGPYFGFMCTKKALIRQLPGRIVGRTVDSDGKSGFTLTLQAREQHIRRSKATSNICTNQGLMVTAATIYMAIMGPDGLEQTAIACQQNTHQLTQALTSLAGITTTFSGPTFHESVITLPKSTTSIIATLAQQNIIAGYALAQDYPELTHSMLICATEIIQPNDIDRYKTSLQSMLN